MTTLIAVPFSQKEKAKALGARWSAEDKSWYIPDGVDPEPFSEWLPVARRITPSSVAKEARLGAAPTQTTLPVESTGDEVEAQAVKHVTLSAFLARVSRVINSTFMSPTWIQVEVSKLSNRGQHAYFDLVEYDQAGKEIAKARASLWASKKAALLAKFKKATGSDIEDGMKVLLLMKAEFSPQFGFSFIVEDVDPAYTLGDMQAKLKAIRDRLISEKLYERNRQLPSPVDFARVAVVSPDGAAGLADFMREADVLQVAKVCQFSYFTAVFQGKDAARSVLAALDQAAAAHASSPYDAIVVIRGGGAASDLAWLNDYDLAARLATMPLPAFTGIGHQIDNTILDEVSHRRFDTPSKVSAFIAGTIVTNANNAIADMVSILKDSTGAIASMESRLDALAQGLKSNSLQAVARMESGLQALLVSIRTTAFASLDLTEQRLQALMSEVVGLSPKKTMERGYAVIRTRAGKPVSRVADLHSGDAVLIDLQDGQASATID